MAATFVQGKIAQTTNSDSSIAGAFDSAVPVGRLIWVAVVWLHDDATRTVSSVQDTSPTNVYTAGDVRTDGNLKIQSWRCFNGVNAAHTVTVTFSGSVSSRRGIVLVEASGVHATDAPVVNFGAASTSTNALNAGSVATTSGDWLILSAIGLGALRAVVQPTGYTEVAPAATAMAAGYRAASTADTYAASWSWTGGSTGSAVAIHEAFAPAAAAGPSLPAGYTYPKVRSLGLNGGLN